MNHANETTPIFSQNYSRRDWLAFGLFWSWNLIFLAFMALGFAPTMLPETFTAVRTGMIPAQYLIYGLVLALIPVVVVLLGLTLLRRAPTRLFALGYVVEGPLMLLLAVRLFLIRQATPAVTLLMLVTLLGMAGFCWEIFRPHERRLGWLRLAGLTLMAVVSLYAAAWLAFYAVPVAAEVLRWLGTVFGDLPGSIRSLGVWFWGTIAIQPHMILFGIFGFLLLLYTASLFVLAPLAVPLLSLRAWGRLFNRQVERLGWILPVTLVCAVLLGCVGLFVLANRQPQQAAFDLLEDPPASTEDARTLLARSDAIRLGLLNAYLAPFRYISSQGEVLHVRNMYASSLRMPSGQALAIQSLYEDVASPLLYNPVHPQQIDNWSDNFALARDPAQAAVLYRRFFDTPITVGERETIVSAVRSTWQADQAEAAWQAVDDREVHLLRQELQAAPYGDWAELELHEVYQNQTADQQEVIYYFNLPESAVITGLWLGSSPNKSEAFFYQIAPRGAAQAVYREQTRVMKDPALVEQIGPRQYRLRAYPVPPLRFEYDEVRNRSLVEEAPELHLWLAWRAFAAADGAFPLPRLAELRNVYWDRETVRLVDGQEMSVSSEDWLPASLPASLPAAPVAHRVDLPGGRSVLALPASQTSLPALPETLSLAVVLDRSRSMEAHASQMVAVLDRLSGYDSSSTPVDLYLTASSYRGEPPSVVPLDGFKPDEILYFGGQNAAQLLAQFAELRQDQHYDAVIVLTDGSGYELGETDVEVPVPDIPVWIVHLGSDIPLGYDDQTLDAIQASGGGVAGDIESALARMAVRMAAGQQPGLQDAALDEQAVYQDILDGYLWLVLPTERVGAAVENASNLQSHVSSDPFTALAARRLILAEMQRNRGSIDQLETLDYLHALAKEYGIVTPYSSMIVLVDAQQRRLLEQLSNLDDRFQREVEDIGETVPGSPLPLTGVPEPHEWILLALVAAMLIYLAYTKYWPELAVRTATRRM